MLLKHYFSSVAGVEDSKTITTRPLKAKGTELAIQNVYHEL